MKRYWLFFLLLFFTLDTRSQISLGSDHLMQAGDSLPKYQIEPVVLDPGPAGANVNWDFSMITTVENPISPQVWQVLPSSSTPGSYAANFPAANLAKRVYVGYEYLYYEVNDTVSWYWGTAADVGKVVYSDPLLEMQLPFTYGTSFQDSFYAQTISPGTFYIRGEVMVSGDAYGILILPSGSYNALRVKTVRQQIDSTYTTEPYVTERTVTYYAWYAESFPYPVMQIEEHATADTTVQYTWLTVPQWPTGIPERQAARLAVFPNPAKGKTQLVFDSQSAGWLHISLFNALGQQVQTIFEGNTRGSMQQEFSTEGLAAGLYFIRCQTEKGNIIRQLMIE